MEFITTLKGGRKLVKDNVLYHKNETLTNGSTYWECDKIRSRIGCKATTNNVIAQIVANAPENGLAQKENGNDAR